MNMSVRKIISMCSILIMIGTVFSGVVTNVSADKNKQENETAVPALENWHYRVPVIVDTGKYNRTDCILSQEINVVKEIGGFGTFDNNSIRVVETNATGTPIWEAVSQFEWLDESSIAVTWIMNDTPPAYAKRYYSIYFDILEYGPKNPAVYPEYVTRKINKEQLWVYGEDYEIKIDRDRGGSREVKINDVPRKGFVKDTTWQSWHSESLSWKTKGAETELVEDGPIYKKVKIVSNDEKQTLYWYFYPDRMKIVFEGEGSISSFDTIADNLLNIKGTLIWDDHLFENLTKYYREYSRPCSYFYILDPELESVNDDVKGRSGFCADTQDGENQTIINAGEKGTRWILGGNEAWFGFAKNEVIGDIVIRSQNPPKITREYSWAVLDSPIIEDEKVFENRIVIIKGNLTVTNSGTVVSIGSSLVVHGNIIIEYGGEFYIVSSREFLPPKPPELPPLPPLPPVRPPIRSTTVIGNTSINGKFFIAKDNLNIASKNDGMNKINVDATGTFESYDAIITAFSGGIPITITNQKAQYEEHYYEFEIYGSAKVIDSEISKLWAEPANLEVGGIQIYSNDVTIEECSILDALGSGIYVNNTTPSINNNTISNCKYGIYVKGGNPIPSDTNTLLSNSSHNNENKDIVNISYGDSWEDIGYEDGTHQITYGVGTYWDGVQWLPANTTLVPSTLADYDYMCEKNTFKIYLKTDSADNDVIKIVYNNASMTLSFSSSNQVSGVVGGSSITYHDIYEHIDITYTVVPRQLKETIIIKQKTNITTHSMKIGMENATYKYGNDSLLPNDNRSRKRIEFLGDNNETVWYILSPYITDSNGNFTNNVTLNITDNEFKFTINNISFLNNATYPIFIDPTIEIPTKITTDTIWYSDNIYAITLRGVICEVWGATLTIQPNVTVWLRYRTGISIRAGGKVIAEGTGHQPINFIRHPLYREQFSYGIELSSPYNILRHCFVSGGFYGIRLEHASHNIIENCTVVGNTYGISLSFSNNNILRGVIARGNSMYGISVYDNSAYNSITDSEIFENIYYAGIHFFHVENNRIVNCKIYNNPTGILAEAGAVYNTISQCLIHHNHHGIFFKDRVYYNHIANCSIFNSSLCGIYFLEKVNYNDIVDNNLYGNYPAIYIMNGCGNQITGNNIHHNAIGLDLYYAGFNSIANCRINDNSKGVHIRGASSTNQITYCHISDCNDGIYVEDTCNYNVITRCNILNNNRYGIYLHLHSDKNQIYHNNFINNRQQAYDDSFNLWDDGVGEGNYWSDYKDRYPYAVEIDGVWSIPYEIPGGVNKDRYPLIRAFAIYPPIVITGYHIIVRVGETVQFDGNLLCPAENIVKYSWDFDAKEGFLDLQEDTVGKIVTHVYENVGIYFVTLTVTDNIGLTSSCYVRVTVWEPIIWTIFGTTLSNCEYGFYFEDYTLNIGKCTLFNNDYGIYCERSSLTIITSYIFANNIDDLYLSADSDIIPINASYNRTKVSIEQDIADTDNDGWKNKEELYIYGFSPYHKDIEDADFDGDNITNVHEAEIYGTDPLNPDTDGDEINDKEEIEFRINPLSNIITDVDYRVVTVYSNRIETKIVKLQAEEVERWEKAADLSGDKLYGPIDLNTIQPAGDIIYPTIGCPKFISLADDRTLEIYVKATQTDYIGDIVKLEKTDKSLIKDVCVNFDTWDSINYARKITIEVPPTTPTEFYNIKIEKGTGNWITALHSLQVYERFEIPFKFVQITDMHLGAPIVGKAEIIVLGITFWTREETIPLPTEYPTAHLLAIIDRINKIEKPDFVIATGDLINYNSLDSIRALKGCLEQSRVPIFTIPGNHDRYTIKTEEQSVYWGGLPIVVGTAKLTYPKPSDPTYYHEWINPKFDSGGEDSNRLADFYFDYNNFRFICMDAGNTVMYYKDIVYYQDLIVTRTIRVPDIEKIKTENKLDGITDQQWSWLQSIAGAKKTFLFIHAPIVGHGGKSCIVNHRADIVNWVNQPGVNVEAVFCGHTHENWIFYDVHTDPTQDGYMDKPYYKPDPVGLNTLSFTDSAFYVETEKST